MKSSFFARAMAVIAKTAKMLALSLPKPTRTGWQPALPPVKKIKPAQPNKAGSKLDRMAREGRVGTCRIR